MLDSTETWCKKQAICNVWDPLVLLTVIVRKRLRTPFRASYLTPVVSFDSNVGHDYIENASERFDFYHKKEDKTFIFIDLLNKITKGGLPNKTLNIALAGTGVGKSLFMCHVAAASLMQGKNAYYTCEMAEEKVLSVLTQTFSMLISTSLLTYPDKCLRVR